MGRLIVYFASQTEQPRTDSIMTVPNSVLTVLVILSLALGLLSLYVVVRLAMREAGRRSLRGVPPDKRSEVMVDAHDKAIQRLEGAVRKLVQGDRRLGESEKEAIRHVGLVRFDAFEDMGGRLSFSAAFLDGRGDGVVITSINGRQDTRCYAKRVQNGTSIHNLSDEERQAIREAQEGHREIVEAS
jgi:hypothetical protein